MSNASGGSIRAGRVSLAENKQRTPRDLLGRSGQLRGVRPASVVSLSNPGHKGATETDRR
jgi:hypothetical protein